MTKPSQSDEPIDPRLDEKLELLRPIPPRDPDAAERGRARFLSELDALFPPEPQPASGGLLGWFRLKFNLNHRQEEKTMNTPQKRFAFTTLTALIVIFVMVFGGATITAYAAQGSLPGDALYSVKTGLEDTRVRLAGDAFNQAQLHMQFAERRLEEISGLIASGRFNNIGTAAGEFESQVGQAIQALNVVSAGDPVRAASLAQQITAALSQYAQALGSVMSQVPESVKPAVEQALMASQMQPEIEFSGAVEAMAADAWTIGGRSVKITPETEIKGVFALGDLVKVHALAGQDGSLTAREIGAADAPGVSDDNGNANLNGNANFDDNGNDNSGNTNLNDNLDDHGNDNTGNTNLNQNDNLDDYGNDNSINSNTNSNSNDNSGNTNMNANSNTNANDNHGGSNSNQNSNTNSNSNDNHNSNDDNSGKGKGGGG